MRNRISFRALRIRIQNLKQAFHSAPFISILGEQHMRCRFKLAATELEAMGTPVQSTSHGAQRFTGVCLPEAINARHNILKHIDNAMMNTQNCKSRFITSNEVEIGTVSYLRDHRFLQKGERLAHVRLVT